MMPGHKNHSSLIIWKGCVRHILIIKNKKKQGPHDNSLVWGHDNDLALLLTNDDAVVGSIVALSDGAKPFLPGSIPDL